MKRKYTLLLASLAFIGNLSAQHDNEFYNDGALVHVQAGAEVHVWGDVHMIGATASLENNGLIKVQGHSYSDALFQQSGTGVYRVENSDVNIGERQFISGSYAVRGGQAQIGVNDGSFYNLELANDQGIVYLVGVGNIADVRNSVDYNAGAVHNRIVTHDIGATGAITYPANGSSYTGVFGIMNPTSGLATQVNNSTSIGGNSSAFDIGYVQGNLRRAISTVGGQYGYVLGLEPAGAGAQRGMQYVLLDLDANNYDVITGYFESGSSNAGVSGLECSGELIDYFGGTDHGEWVFNDITGTGAGTYEVRVWPQDDNLITAPVWIITKDDAFQGTVNDCGPSPVGLSRSGFNGFSEFGVAAPTSALPIELIDISAVGVEDHIKVVWNVASESNLSHYELERSEDGTDFELIATLDAQGNTTNTLSYQYDDYDVRGFQHYYYQVRSVDLDGTYEYTPVVVASIDGYGEGFNENVVSLYPNPTNSNTAVAIHADQQMTLSMTVMSASGQLVHEQKLLLNSGNTIVNLASNQWANGVYLVELRDELSGKTITKRLIKN
ncbi:MAG: T9SS type A sorting domain-containing protein [bacterium]|nr:T9SS type A sorting domain-containing protein [bacterium]